MSVISCTSQPNAQTRYLFPEVYMADPDAHVFNGMLYIYPSHDRRSNITNNSIGDTFDAIRHLDNS